VSVRRLVVELVGDELVATDHSGQIYRQQCPFKDEGEIENELASFVRKHLDDADRLTVVGPSVINGETLLVKHSALNSACISRTTIVELLDGLPVELSSGLNATSAWLRSDVQRVAIPLQGNQELQPNYNTKFALVLINLTATDVVLQMGLVDGNEPLAHDTWPYFLPATSQVDAVSYLRTRLEQLNAPSVAIIFTPHPFHSAYGYYLKREAGLTFQASTVPVAMYTDALAVRTGVEIISSEPVG
jgi:hypothetical protein